MEVAAPPATSVPALGSSATAAVPSKAAAPPSAAAAHRTRREEAANRVGRERRRRRGVDCEEWEQEDVAGAKADGAGGEVMPTAAMVEAMVGTNDRAREIREVGMEIKEFWVLLFRISELLSKLNC